MVWGISIDNVKRYFANRLIHHIVVNKLNMWQYSFPVPLLINTNITQHIFQSSFDYLCLPICLKIEGTTKLQLHVRFILQMMPKLTSELHIPIRIFARFKSLPRHSFDLCPGFLQFKHLPSIGFAYELFCNCCLYYCCPLPYCNG